MEQWHQKVLIVGIRQDIRFISDDEIKGIQNNPGFTKYILDLGDPNSFEIDLIQSGVECVIYEGMVNGVFGKILDTYGLKTKSNRVQGPFIETEVGDNVVWRYKQELEDRFGVEFPIESEVLYDDFILDVIKRSSQESRIFSRELDENGRFVNFRQGQNRKSKADDFDLFCEYLELVKENGLENKTRQPRTNYPQLSLDMLNLCVFLSQIRPDKSKINQACFFGGPTSNTYMPKGFRSMEKLFRNKIVPNCEDLFPNSLEFILYDVSIQRGENSYK